MVSHNANGRIVTGLITILLAGAAAGCASTGPYSQGPQLVTGSGGMTLYRFDHDERGSGESACYDACAAKWPPAPATVAHGRKFGSLTRSDGTVQLTYDGWPVYYYAGDNRPGEKKGDSIGGVWHAVEALRMGRGNSQSEVTGGGGY